MPPRAVWQFSTLHGGLDVMREVPGGAPDAELSEESSPSVLSRARSVHPISIDLSSSLTEAEFSTKFTTLR
jgi:hypothetical protein